MKHTSGYLKKTLSAVMAFIMAFGAFSSAGIIGLIASAADDIRGDRPLYEDKNGEWKFYDDGELVFIGSSISPVDAEDTKHWRDVDTQEDFTGRITSVTVAPSVREINSGAFRFLKVNAAFIPDSVNDKGIAVDAFDGSSIKTVYFPGHDTLWKEKYAGADTAPAGVTVKFDHRHSEDILKHHVEATCLKTGYEGDYYCSVCGSFVKKGKTLDKSSHTWSKEKTYIVDSEGNTLKETCKDNGKKARYCTVCGEWDYANAETVKADSSKHEFTILDKKIKNCSDLFSTAEGCKENFVDLKCKHCGKKLSDLHGPGKDYAFYLDYVDSNNKKVGSYVLFGNDASGVNSGWKAIPADKQSTVVNRKAVEEYGMYREQMTYKTPADALNHHRIIGEETVEPTCTGEGKTVIICEWCSEFREEYKVAALGHSDTRGNKDVIVEVTPAKCPDYDKGEKNSDADGKRVTRCTDCGIVLSDEKLLNLHDVSTRSGTWVTVKEPTCVEEGVKQLRCNHCKRWIRDNSDNPQPLTQSIPKNPSAHKVSRWIYTKEPTCVDSGERIKICLNPGCPNYVGPENKTAAAAAKASDRAALDVVEDVVKDTDRENYEYAATSTDPKIYDITEEINTAVLKAFQQGVFEEATPTEGTPTIEKVEENIYNIFATAVKHHGKWRVNIETLDEYFMLDEAYYKEVYPKVAEGCIGEATGSDARYVFEEIVKGAVKNLIEKDNTDDIKVDNTADDIIKALEDAWTSLGDEAIKDALKDVDGKPAELTNKAIATETVAPLKHNFVRVPYVVKTKSENGVAVIDYVPVGKNADAWYKITGFEKDENGELKKDDNGDLIPVLATGSDAATYTDAQVIKKVDCTKGDGIKLYVCTNTYADTTYNTTECMEEKTETVSKRQEHDFVTETVEATCEEGKYEIKRCKYCDIESEKLYIGDEAGLGHDMQPYVVREATCSKAGIEVMKCSRCDYKDKKTYKTVQPLPHTWSIVSVPAKCLEDGKEGKECAVCGYFEGEIIPALGHDYVEEIVAPTCTEPGYTTATCSRCGDTKAPYNQVPPAGHQYGETLNMAATCTKGSYSYKLCKVCGYEKVYNEIDNALGHSMTTIAAKAATCTADGYTEKVYCSRCDYVEKESTVIKATGHTPKNVPYKASSCTEDGNEAYVVCSKCGTELEKKVVLPKTGHHWKTTPGFEATCETAGQTDSTVCEICGEYQKAPVTIPAKGHSWGAGKIIKEALLTGNDIKEFTCSVCGQTKQEEIPVKWYQRLIRIILYIFSLPFKLMARANGE